MHADLIVRSAQASDKEPWRTLWRAYCAALNGLVSDSTTESLWHRILAANEPVWCVLVCRPSGEPIGFANYVLHPHTWSPRMVCYLEDLYVTPEARGSGAGRALIERLVEQGKQNEWRRVYWHTHEENHSARLLYDRVTSRTDYVRYDIEL